MTDTTTTECEIFLYVDQDGDFVVAKDIDELADKYSDEVTSNVPANVKVFSIKLVVPLPKVTAARATIPDTDGEVTVTIA